MESFWSDPFGWIGRAVWDLLLGLGLPAVLVDALLLIVGALLIVAIVLTTAGIFLIWLERKLSARFQDRLGPNRVGPFGLLQTVADALKLITKEDVTPEGADKVVFNLAPLLAVMSVAGIWAVVPFAPRLSGADLNVGLLYIVAIGGVGTLAIIMGGWASNNKYALLGALRTVAMLVSFEVPMVLALLVPTMLAGSMGLTDIVRAQDEVWFIVMAPVAAIIFFTTSIAEIGRTPFDLAEAESELVAGFNIEYSGMKFGMFFVAEFLHAFTIGALFGVLFLGGWNGPGAERFPLLGLVYFLIKAFLGYFIVVWLRFTFPRIRIDQMLGMNWKFLTPLALATVSVTAIADKLALGLGWNRVATLLAANAFLVVATFYTLRAYARAVRRRLAAEESEEALESAASMEAAHTA